VRDAETAPIDGLTRGSSGSGRLIPDPAPRPGAERSTPDAAETVPITRIGGVGPKATARAVDTAPARPDSGAAASGPTAPDYASGDARRELRRASRRRRRYERSEARRFTQRSRRRRLTWIVVGASLAGLVLVVLLAAYSPLLAVRTLAIEGTSRLDAAAVTAALQPQVGKPLALVDYGAIETELAGFPLIASYSVEARPPDTLAVRIVERRPVAQVQSATGFDLIDAAGVTVQQSAERIPGFPLIDLGGTQIGSRGFDAAAAVLAALPDAILSQVDRVSGSTPDSVTMVFGGVGQRVVWGSAEDSELKARILERLIATQDPNRAVEYDVSSPQSPVVR